MHAHHERAAGLAVAALRLKQAFNAAFWDDADGHYALALDGAKRRVRAKTSNPGHALWSGIVDDARVPGVVADMLAPAMFSGWGSRRPDRRPAHGDPGVGATRPRSRAPRARCRRA